jgi:hypothetical protein
MVVLINETVKQVLGDEAAEVQDRSCGLKTQSIPMALTVAVRRQRAATSGGLIWSA